MEGLCPAGQIKKDRCTECTCFKLEEASHEPEGKEQEQIQVSRLRSHPDERGSNYPVSVPSKKSPRV